jgi:DNA-3-methyladenine glycosylase II
MQHHAIPDRIETADDLAAGAAVLVDLDPRFGPVLDDAAPLALRRRADGFGALLDAIVGQQLSTKAAAAIRDRLTMAGYITPAAITNADDDALRACGLSRPKIKYIRALARADLDYDALRNANQDEIAKTLTALPGIGKWTADIYILFALGHMDGFAAGDLALQIAAGRLVGGGDRMTERVLLQQAELWRPVRAVAARALWAYYRIDTNREGVL